MTNPDDPPITENALAAGSGIARDVLVGLRKAHLTPDDDFANVPRAGITYTPAGLEKINALILPLLDASGSGSLEKTGAAPQAEPETVVLIVKSVSRNGGRSCLCHREGTEPPQRAFVSVSGARQRATTLRPGMRLVGCRQTYPGNPEVFDYPGPVPARLGLPLPDLEKKEPRP